MSKGVKKVLFSIAAPFVVCFYLRGLYLTGLWLFGDIGSWIVAVVGCVLTMALLENL